MLHDAEQKPSEENEGVWQCVNCQEELQETFDACWNCGTDREEQKDSEFDGLEQNLSKKCPHCDSEMEVGQCQIEATLGGFLMFGFSYKHLFFVSQYGKRHKAVDNSEYRASHRCEECGLIMIL